MFSVHTSPGENWKHNSRRLFWICVWGKLGKPYDYRDLVVREKLRFRNDFRQHENAKPAFSSGLKSVFEKPRFRDGLVWTVGLIVERKLRFQIPLGSVDGAIKKKLERGVLKSQETDNKTHIILVLTIFLLGIEFRNTSARIYSIF